jgi:hypothetical protein
MPAGFLQHAQIFRDVALGQPGAAADFFLDANAVGDGVNGDPLAGVVIGKEVARVAKGNELEVQLAVGAAASAADTSNLGLLLYRALRAFLSENFSRAGVIRTELGKRLLIEVN